MFYSDRRLLLELYDFAQKLRAYGCKFSLDVCSSDEGAKFTMFVDAEGELRLKSQRVSFVQGENIYINLEKDEWWEKEMALYVEMEV